MAKKDDTPEYIKEALRKRKGPVIVETFARFLDKIGGIERLASSFATTFNSVPEGTAQHRALMDKIFILMQRATDAEPSEEEENALSSMTDEELRDLAKQVMADIEAKKD